MLSLVLRIRVVVALNWLGVLAVSTGRTGAVACSFRHGIDGVHGWVVEAGALASPSILVVVPDVNVFIETALALLCSANKNL